ncbi:MAG: hypothetical protein KFH87_12610, partial [Bacteroidetes bacterium]|nr:hypothetical protein [Bacteroidota bacterium]
MNIRPYILIATLLALPSSVMTQTVQRVSPPHEHSPFNGLVVTGDGTLYAAGWNNVLVRSTDGGMSWRQLPMEEHRLHIHQLATDGRDLYLLAFSYEHAGRPELWPDGYHTQLFRYDPGEEALEHLSFPLLDRLAPDLLHEFGEFSLAATGEGLYLSYQRWPWLSNDALVLVSRDGGSSWENVSLPDPPGNRNGRYYIRTRPPSGDILIYYNSRMQGVEKSTLYLSTDAGTSWKVDSCESRLGAYRDSPALFNIGGGRLLTQASNSSILIHDGQKGWMDRGSPPFGELVECIADAEGFLYAFTLAGGVFRSNDDAASWLQLRPEVLSPLNKTVFLATPFGATGLVAVNQQGTILISHDRGISWEDPQYMGYQYNFASMADSTFGIVDIVNIKSAAHEFHITDDGFATLSPCPPFPLSRAFPVTRTLWYAVGWNGFHDDSLLCRSTDGGATWNLVLGMPETRAFTTTIEVRDTSSHAVATSRGIFFTPDRGENWEHILEAEWTSQTGPVKIILTGRGEPVWLIPDRSEPFSIVRSDPSWQRWDTVLVLSEEDRQYVTSYMGISDICVTEDGRVFTFSLADKRGDGPLIHVSDDGGLTWQSWRGSSDGHEQHNGYRPLLFPSGAIVMRYVNPMTRMTKQAHTHVISASTNLMRSDTILLERTTSTNLLESIYLSRAGDRMGYLLAGRAVFRITVPESTASAASVSPPLPLSIATPHPHPLSRRTGSATLFIQSGQHDRVHLQAFDMTGRLVARLYEGELGPEGRHVAWNTAT